MSYKCAFLGCGGRSNAHAGVYPNITRGTAVACCDLIEEKAQEYAGKHDIPSVYTDLDEMLEKEKPDLVHMVMPPTIRVSLMTRLAEAGVPAVIVEKPICIGAEDYKALRELEAASDTKFAVNHQLRYHPKIMELLDYVNGGGIGEVRFLDASSVLPMSGQGVHVLDLLFAFADYEPVQTVFGASAGYDDINGTHPSPRTAESLINFPSGKRAALQAGEGAPMMAPDQPRHMHKRIATYGTRGFIHWTMWGWERSLPDGTLETGEHDYRTEDNIAEANLVNAMFDWLEDDGKVAPTNLSTSLDEWLVILAGYQSSITQNPVDMPFDPADDLLERFKAFAGAE